jgi:hypothetical protein
MGIAEYMDVNLSSVYNDIEDINDSRESVCISILSMEQLILSIESACSRNSVGT